MWDIAACEGSWTQGEKKPPKPENNRQMGSKRGKKHAKRALPLYVTPRIAGDPKGD